MVDLTQEAEVHLPCKLLFGAAPQQGAQHMTNYTTALIEQLHDFSHYAYVHMKLTSNKMQAHYNHLAGFQEEDEVWFYSLTKTTEESLSCNHPGKSLA
jgi:hypothetical protein